MLGSKAAHLGDLRMAVGVGQCGRQLVFGHVAGVDRALGGEQEKVAHQRPVFVAEIQGEGRFPLVEVGQQEVDQFDFAAGVLIAALGLFFAGDSAFFEGCEVGQDQFRVDDLDIADGIDGAEFVDDIVVFEAAHDLDDGVGFADGGEELVAEAGALGGPLDQAGDIDELDGGGHQTV